MHTANPRRLPCPVFLLLLLGLLSLLGASVQAANIGYRPTGSISVGHAFHTATLLPNGKVLVAGGQSVTGNNLNTAELYDPSTGTWSSTGNLITGRGWHSATLLPNGKVLVVGGTATGAPSPGFSNFGLASAELYDPATGIWSAAASLPIAVSLNTATLLLDGRVLVVSGLGPEQLYDPVTGTWTSTGALKTHRVSHTATLLANGKVLVAGGRDGRGATFASAELYDPQTGVWTGTGSLAQARYNHTATVLASGEVVVDRGSYDFGGGGTATLTTSEAYDPASGTWGSLGAVLPGEDQVAYQAALQGPTATATLLPSGDILLAGGYTLNEKAQLYGPVPAPWSAAGALISPRQHHTATLLPNGQVLAAGGNDSTSGTRVELYNPTTKAWTGTSNFTLLRDSHTATLLPSGKVLVAGGRTGSTQIKTAELYDPATGNWTATGSLAAARTSHTATLLGNGLVLVTGGMGPASLASCELYDPATGMWTGTGGLHVARDGHTAILLANGMVVVAGGRNAAGAAVASAEVYDPATGNWTSTGNLGTARYGHTASLLPSGQVLVAGGVGSAPLASAELYDPTAGLWTATGALATARSGHTATVLPSGWVAVLGGVNSGGSLTSVQLYNPAAGTWRVGASLAGARDSHTATLLANGFLLVAGGYGPVAGGSNGLLNTSESYDFSGPLDDPTALKLATATLQANHGTAVVISGNDLLGTNMVVTLRNMMNGQVLTLLPSTPPTSTSYTSLPIGGLEPGSYLVTVYAGGVASNSIIVQSSSFTATATTVPATQVTPYSVRLQAMVAGYGTQALVAFEYSTDPAMLQNVVRTSATMVVLGSPSPLSQTVLHLASATAYYFRVVVSASSEEIPGDTLSFTTAPAIPTAATPPDVAITPTGNLIISRIGHSAVLLPNGKVLLVGGFDHDALATVEIYDPATGVSRAAASLLKAHSNPTATLLPNGKVLVVGLNSTGGQHSAGAELYDPVVGTWSSTSAAAGYNPAVTLLPNGKVLVAGGTSVAFPIRDANLYDPATGNLTPTGKMTIARNSSSATLLPSGKVLMAGDGASAELYDPATGVWTATGSMGQGDFGHAAVLLPNGKVLVVGGSIPEQYDPATGNWTSAGTLNVARSVPTLTLLPNGKVWLAGGSTTSTVTELYDPVTGMWTLAGNLAAPRDYCTATLLPDGHVYVAGDGTAEIYNPARGFSTAEASPGTARGAHTATVLPSGKVLLAGGTNEAAGPAQGLAACELYDPIDRTWTSTASLHGPRQQHSATLMPNGKVLVAGGLHGAGLASSEMYDPASEMWAPTGNLLADRYNHTATLLAGGKVLIAGGGDGAGLLASTELYDPASETWTTVGNLGTPRKFHTATVLPNGQVLVAGGWDASGHAVVSAELYEAGSGVWRAVGDLVTARANHAAALLADGRVLVAGGRDEHGLLAASEVYDPVTEMWMPTRDLFEARAFQSATLLGNGKVLMAEGIAAAQAPDDGLHASGEIYDPAVGRWVSAGSLVQGRSGHTATLLLTGQVLLAGGDRSASAGTAELYDAGLGFDSARQAQLLGNSMPFGGGRALTLSGNRLLGPRGAGSSTPRSSDSYFPVVQLRNLATDQVQTLLPIASPATSATSWTSLPVSGLPLGYYAVTLFTNGIPSNSLVAQVESGEPLVTTTAATSLAAGSATLHGLVTANGLSTTVSFAYGTDAAVTQNVITTPAQVSAASASDAPVSQAITGLSSHRIYYYQVIATNSAATVKGAIVSFTTDNTAPIAPGGNATATTGDAKTITLPYAATDADGDALTLVSVSGPNLSVNGTNGNQVTLTPDAAFVGTATLTYQISDGTGLANGIASGVITVTVSDNDAPDTSITSAPSGMLTTRAASISFGGTDNIGVSSFQGRLDGAAFAPVTSPVNLTGLADGAHTYDVRALDAAGNVDATPARASWSVNTTAPPVDNTPPVLHLPADFAVEATTAAGAVVTYTASATDAGSGVASSSFTPPSGSQFVLGTTVVQATATDVAGNTSSGSFQVTVRDTSPPVIVLAGANPLHVALHGLYEDPGATATDAVEGSVEVTVTGTVDVNTEGNYTITYHATDSTGHGDTAKRTVIVGRGFPLAVDDHYFSGSAKRTPLVLHVLDNDTALHPALLSVVSVTRPLYGSAVVAADGKSITYTPAMSYASFAGKEVFSYTVRDDFGGTATARVTISNDAYREKGLYDGLLLSDEKVIGYVQVNLTGTGMFTGTLRVGIASTMIRGQFDVDQHANVPLPGASLELQFDGEANMAATYVKGALMGQGTLSHATYNVATNPAPQAGSYTVLLPPAPAPAGTAAIASVVVNEFTHKVIGLPIGSGGSGYVTPPMVTILSPVGSGATAVATLTNGSVTGLAVTTPGLRYPDNGATVIIDHPGENLPTGSGYATMKVTQAGAVTLSGKLGDGTVLSASGWVKEDGSMALYKIVAYRPGPAGTLSGMVTFDEVPDVSDFDGDLAWSKPRQKSAALYRNGFETTSHLIGSHYRAPMGEQALVFSNTEVGNAGFATSGGDLSRALNDIVTFNQANAVREISGSADRLMLRIVPSTGLFSGTFLGIFPAGTTATRTKSTSYSGVLFQKQNLGEGLVIGLRHTGEVTLMPQ